MMASKDVLEISLREILDYAEGQKGLSYYDLETYAYDSDKEGWIAALKDRDSRQFVALFLQSKRRKDKVPYVHPQHVSMAAAVEAKCAYMKRHAVDYDVEDSE